MTLSCNIKVILGLQMILWCFLINFYIFLKHLINSLNVLNLLCLDFCSLHLQLLERTIFTIPRNGPQARYTLVVVAVFHFQRAFDDASVIQILTTILLSGFVEQVSWSTCFEREGKEIRPRHINYKVM